ncbi:MAG: helix-turn-helix domain-containing protein [Ruminococcaceae bacterium]|nr:helix-turn-helix domain-containing protein [Oscillospiraceae bacterium]
MVSEFTSDYEAVEELRLNNCGIQHVHGSLKFTQRVRKDFTVMYILKGHAQVEIDGVIENVFQGDAMLFTPGTKQKYRFDDKQISINMWIHFSGTFCSVLCSKGARIVSFSGRNEIESNIERLVRYRYTSLDKSNMLCDAYLRAVIAQICYEEQMNESRVRSAKTKNCLDDVLNDIHTKPYAHFDWDKCAAGCFVSRDRFNHIFKECVGYPPEKYRIKVCMERARTMICDIGMSVGECASSLGFNDVSYFCRRFKAEYGISPGKLSRTK